VLTGSPRLPGELGEIWVHGPSVGNGYWRDRASATDFEARMAGVDKQPYLRTANRASSGGANSLSPGGSLT
jgi:acyl-CoA synthetase (AMP-forming)/AMP-acid ligase II